MQKSATICPTASDRVIQRLREEGWVECHPLTDCLCQAMLIQLTLSEFVIYQLQQAGGQLQLRDLQLECLVFSRETHEFLVHPQLSEVLEELQRRGTVRQQGKHLYLR